MLCPHPTPCMQPMALPGWGAAGLGTPEVVRLARPAWSCSCSKKGTCSCEGKPEDASAGPRDTGAPKQNALQGQQQQAPRTLAVPSVLPPSLGQGDPDVPREAARAPGRARHCQECSSICVQTRASQVPSRRCGSPAQPASKVPRARTAQPHLRRAGALGRSLWLLAPSAAASAGREEGRRDTIRARHGALSEQGTAHPSPWDPLQDCHCRFLQRSRRRHNALKKELHFFKKSNSGKQPSRVPQAASRDIQPLSVRKARMRFLRTLSK